MGALCVCSLMWMNNTLEPRHLKLIYGFLFHPCLISVRWKTWRASSAPRWPTTSCWFPRWASSACGQTRRAAKVASAFFSRPTKNVRDDSCPHSHSCCLSCEGWLLQNDLATGGGLALFIRTPCWQQLGRRNKTGLVSCMSHLRKMELHYGKLHCGSFIRQVLQVAFTWFYVH